MVLLLNLLVGVFVLSVLWFSYNTLTSAKLTADQKLKRVVATLVISLVSFWVYQSVQPSYMYKGAVERTSLAEYEYVNGEIKDITPKPMPSKERDAKRIEAYKDVIPFVEQNRNMLTPLKQ